MIVVKISVKDKDITGFEVKGHAGYAKYGRDIVCSAVSAIVQTALLGLIDLSTGKVEYIRNEETGYLSFTVPTPITEEEGMKQQAVLRTAMLGLQDMERGYKAYLKTEVK